MSNKNLRWLYDELPKLVAQGIVAETSAQRLRDHYGPLPAHRPGRLAVIIFGVVGAGLVGLGIILLFAHNWDGLSRPLRAGMLLALLAAAQCIAGFTLLKRAESRAWTEASALFLALCVGASISLVAQTYNIPGDLGGFLLTWMLLVFPLMYLFDAGVVCVGYLAGITWWSGYVQFQEQNALWFWPLAAAAAPFLVRNIRGKPSGIRALWLMWALSLNATVAAGLVIERALPGLWIPLYASLLTVMYLGGVFFFDAERAPWQRPFRSTGAVGLAVLSLVLTFEDPWRHVGWTYYRTGTGYDSWAAIADYVLTGALFLSAVALLVTAIRRGRAAHIPFGVAPLLAMAGFVIAAGADDSFVPWATFNIYVFAVSLLTIFSGVRTSDMRALNEGLLFLSALIVVRFFDSDLPMSARGLAFIVIGVGFLAANLAMVSRKRRTSP